MSVNIKEIYQNHHRRGKRSNYSVMEKERAKLLKQYIGKGKKILDLGCRDGTLTKYFIEGNEVTGVDIDEYLLKKATDEFNFKTEVIDLNGNWSELESEKFDVIVAGEILEHLYFPEDKIDKVVNFLEPNGLFIGSVPNAFSLKNRLRYLKGQIKNTPLADPTHINQFSYNNLKSILEKYFNEVEIIGLGRLSNLARLNPNFFAFDLMFICRNNFR